VADSETNPRLTPEFNRTLRRYVLSDLDEAARIEVEELLINDPHAFEALGVVEDELVEEYLDGGGTDADRQTFERHYLTSPQREAHLRFARSLRERASRTAAASPRPQRQVVYASRWQPAWIGLAAALALSLAGNVWLALRPEPRADSAAHPTPAVAVGPSAAPTTPLPPQTSSTTPRDDGRNAAFREREARTPTAIATFALAGGALRSGGPQQHLTLPAGALVVRLRLELSGDDYPLYRAALVNAEGEELWSAWRLKSETGGSQSAVAVIVPASLLLHGDYQVKLSGGTRREDLEAVASYAFRMAP